MIRVMVVEDDISVANLLETNINNNDTFFVSNSCLTVQQARKAFYDSKFDLILFDVYLPDGNGLELLQEFRQNGYEGGAIVITAENDTAAIRRALSSGVFDYIIKSAFGIERLQKALGKFKTFWHTAQDNKQMQQGELNKLFNVNMPVAELEKGLDETTMAKIYEIIKSDSVRSYSSDDMARLINTSVITARKYLEFLYRQQIMSRDAVYAKIGRPTYIYRLEKDKLGEIEQYVLKAPVV